MNGRPIRFVAKSLAQAGFLYLRFCYATSKFTYTEQALRSLKNWWSGVPSVFVCWHDECLTCLLTLQQPPIRERLPVFITNDSPGGVLYETFCRCVGLPYIIIPRKERRDLKLTRMAEGLKTHRGLAIAADYGKPWFEAHPTSRIVASTAEGVLVPMSIQPKFTWVLKLRDGKRVQVPLPFNTYTLRMSSPQEPANLEEAGALSRALNALREPQPIA